MKFHLAINMERLDDSLDMDEVARHTLEMVQMADRGGFHIAWAAEHHALEMTIAPNPFQILTWWAGHTDRIHLGSAIAVAAYWHPIDLAGEAALLDLISGGRLEFGIGSGAYQREFDRMRPGLKQSDGWRYMQEMLPVVKALWAGDYEHVGEFWQFPTATSVPKPVQKPHPPIWVAARSPVTFDYAVKHGCNVMSWPLTRPFAEAEKYNSQLDEAVAANPGSTRPTFAMMRHTALYDTAAGREAAITALQRVLGQFENLFRNLGDVQNGFPKQISLDELTNREQYNANMLEENLMFGSPGEVIAKLKRYEALGVDEFIYYASMGLGQAEQKRSMELFCNEVIPAFG
jgi:alkanesulfonate monooxygenase SsuD/methylene tetrahydromethanopterin reductase-like flavin-dependent oxidoreductase (luciferase family)